MSVLIKGMDMPNNCLECNFEYDCMMCKITGTSFIWGEDGKERTGFYEEEQRLPDCPLVEVKTPHGRLIDADAEIRKIESIKEKVKTDRGCIDVYVGEIACLKLASTVIESEG